MMKSRLAKYIDKIIRFKKVGGKKWQFGYGCGVHIKNPDDILMMMGLDELGEPTGNMKQLRVYDTNGYTQVVQVIICEHQYLLGGEKEEND